jgi:TATA-box binding protein (TBP) (component of TFIID and TFIIIB)
MEIDGGLVFKIVTTAAAILIGITGWLIITGGHNRYYKRALRDPYYKKWLRPAVDQNDKSTKT